MILAGRRLNDSMGIKIVEQVLKLMTKKRINLIDARILVMGLSFKENCPDIRNTKVIDIINELTDCNCKVDVYDPWVNKSEVFKEYGFNTIDELFENQYDAIIIAVSHDKFRLMTIDKIRKLGKKTNVIYDVKYLFKPNDVDGRL